MSALERLHFNLTEAAAKVSVNPNPGGLPGVDAFQKLLNGAAALALLACVAAFVIGAAQWGFGSRSQNYSQAADGKERMLKSVGGAFGIGAVAAVINFFYQAGTGVK
jgi:Family of unknown function (DUF6112)